MPKSYDIKQLKQTLIIVESPAKCKKIESFLGVGYKCIATFGHVRECKSLENIETKNDFQIKYDLIQDAKKRKYLDSLGAEIKKSGDVYLATDDDREGEAIAWHICMLFNLPVERTKRIVFHEITQNAIKNALKMPRHIDMNKVNSQQARQVLDLLIGFKISPILWKTISKNSKNSLSAGRCQTPALKLIYENQKEIDESCVELVYKTKGIFTNQNILFELNHEFLEDKEVNEFLKKTNHFNHVYNCTEPVKIKKHPPQPFSTSTIQQKASNEFHFSPKETMQICQSLYEEGYITYMRTDSKKYSKEFIESSKSYILKYFGSEKYISQDLERITASEIGDSNPTAIFSQEEQKGISILKRKKTNTNTNTNTNTKDSLLIQAHEAIRPTNIYCVELPEKMNLREKKIYKLIWTNSLQSCMSDSEYYSITASLTAENNYNFIHHSELLDFAGWEKIKNEKSDKNEKKNSEYNYLLQIKQSKVLSFKKVLSTIQVKNQKNHYTEARLVQLLEEKGIGRPSTFSSLVDKIQEREYVVKQNIPGKEIICKEFELENNSISCIDVKREIGNEKSKLVIQNVGKIVCEFLYEHFDELFCYNYTKSMEDELDRINCGEKIWYFPCRDCLNLIENILEKNSTLFNKKVEFKIDENHYYIVGKNGPIIKCIDAKDKNIIFKPVREDIDLVQLSLGKYKLEDIIDNEKINKPTCILLGRYENQDLVLKKGKYGLYVTWGKNSKSLSCLGNRPIENIRLEEVYEILKK